jgi:hypothetical protein
MSSDDTKDAFPAIDAAMLATAIREEAAEWIAVARVATIREIGQGHCYDFAEAVMDRLGMPGHGSGWLPEDSHGRLIDCVTDDWWRRVLNDDGTDAGEAECFVADIARLRREGAPLPTGLDDEVLSDVIGSATHNWLVLDGRHHDATCPDGADHFLVMPFFADQIAGEIEARSKNGIAA